jgi:gamma-glutamylcysteine synthetase
MARDTTDPTPIESRDELVAYLEAGCKPEADFRIGTERMPAALIRAFGLQKKAAAAARSMRRRSAIGSDSAV